VLVGPRAVLEALGLYWDAGRVIHQSSTSMFGRTNTPSWVLRGTFECHQLSQDRSIHSCTHSLTHNQVAPTAASVDHNPSAFVAAPGSPVSPVPVTPLAQVCPPPRVPWNTSWCW
jgi:hypothetical protein